jgi:AcrR family transcriptional regulator
MENNVPSVLKATLSSNRSPIEVEDVSADSSSAVGEAVDRSLAGRRLAARDEVERLVSAAFRVIEKTGHLEPKVSDILHEAGLSNQAFYRHFRGKHELLVAVLDEGIRGLGSYLTGRVAEATSPSAAVREWIRGMAAQVQDPSGAEASRPFALGRGRLAELFPVEVARSEGRVTAPLRAALEAARFEGSMPAVDPKADAEALYHLMMGWVEARLVEARIPTEIEVTRLEAFAMAGLERALDLPNTPSVSTPITSSRVGEPES